MPSKLRYPNKLRPPNRIQYPNRLVRLFHGTPPTPNIFPSDIPDLQLYLDPDSIVGSEGSTVATFPDISGNSRDATAQGASDPTLLLTGLGGKPAVNFLGDMMATPSFMDSVYQQNSTLFLVCGPSDGVAAARVVMSSNSLAWYIVQNPDTLRNKVSSVQIGDSTSECPVSVSTFSFSGTVADARSLSKGILSSTIGSSNSGLSGILEVGNNSGFDYNGKLGKIVLYNRVLTDEEKLRVETYLSRHYSVYTNRVICIGNSLTEGIGATPWSYPGLMAQQTAYNVVRYGIPGCLSNYFNNAPSYANFEQAKTPNEEWVIVWNTGTNDQELTGIGPLTFTPQQSIDNTETLCNIIRGFGYKVIVPNQLVRGDAVDPTYQTTYNTLLQAQWGGFADAYVDLAVIPGLSDFNNTTYFDPDKVHLKTPGYQLVLDAILPFLP